MRPGGKHLHISYVNAEEFIPDFAKETGISDLGEQIRDFVRNPIPEGKIIFGKKRTSLKLMIPNQLFKEHLEMGETSESIWGNTTLATAFTGLYQNK